MSNGRQFIDSEEVSSDFNFVEEHISVINSISADAIKFSKYSHFVETRKSGNVLYEKINKLVDSYFSVQKSLMVIIQKKDENIMKVANDYKDADASLERQAGH